ncbi:hypothetical protein [Paracoccus sp. (in: a-proteobacteria)]|uniref:hypothetical protein n=1 Tax=Paracoccus sp. TaxID=267 RepID=UPI00289F51DD|nr:hypothetical protein [Paracoccus sp. (in: a-proteobacteria)]
MNSDDITELFTRDGKFFCAKWGRPVSPVIFGLEDESLAIFRDVLAAVLRDIRHPMMETDPEMGANLMMFFVRDWSELAEIPDLDSLTGQPDLAGRLSGQDADECRIFRFDADGSIRACLTFVNMSGGLAQAHPAQLAEALAVRAMLTFARDVVPSVRIAELLRAAYDPALTVAATDPSHALRLAARIQAAPRLS